MTLLLHREPSSEEPAAPSAAPEARACATCGTEMQQGQDWCLRCGQAQPGRLGSRPGGRAAATVVALTLLLCGGAVAASYAALQDDASRQAAAPPTAAPLAQVPAPVPTPAPAPAPTDTAPLPPAPADKGADVPPPAPAPSTSKPTAPATPRATTPSTGTKDSGSSTGTTKDSGTTKTTKPAAPVAIDLGADAMQGYDPYSRATDKTDPVDAYDGDSGTAWKVTVPDGSQQIGTGLVVDLGSKRGVKALELTTRTRGFRAEVYATDSAELPPDVLDTRWAHVKDASDIGSGNGKERIVLGGGSTKYRHVLLWFTTPPSEGATVAINELTLFGS